MGTSENAAWGATKRGLQLVRFRIETLRFSANIETHSHAVGFESDMNFCRIYSSKNGPTRA